MRQDDRLMNLKTLVQALFFKQAQKLRHSQFGILRLKHVTLDVSARKKREKAAPNLICQHKAYA